ncbi:MAG: hypothetical protein AAF634_09755, partial [Bacteroidota bacterium]
MNEEHLKKVLQKSKIETSKDFTDNLMRRIDLESQNAIQNSIGISFKRLLILCGCLIVIIGLLTFRLVGTKMGQIPTEGKNIIAPSLVLVFGIVLYSLNNFIRTIELSL